MLRLSGAMLTLVFMATDPFLILRITIDINRWTGNNMYILKRKLYAISYKYLHVKNEPFFINGTTLKENLT